ncbi:MAG: hypothetical protein ACFCVE_16205 [Phycisphaerae bacterium]
MNWDQKSIVAELKKLKRSKADLSYNALAHTHQSLLSAAAYHFESYRKAVEAAGIDYAEVSRRPRWTKLKIIKLIKDARKRKQDLHWSAVTKRGDELAKAAFASLQPRLFGKWDRALAAAGIDADEVNLYRSWNKDAVVTELKQRAADSYPLGSGALQQEDPGLHAAAVRYFGRYDDALKAARLDPEQHRERRRWMPEAVTRGLRDAKKRGLRMSDSVVRREEPALYGAAVRLFGSFTAAREAANLKL